MKYIVTGSANLRFADGTSFTLTPGIHDDFPAAVKKHWAFAHHAEELSDSAAVQQASDDTQSARITVLESEIGELNARLTAAVDANEKLTTQLTERDAEIIALNARLTAASAPAEDKGGKTDKK